MKAQFEMHLDEDLNLWAFDYGLKSLLLAAGGGSFQKTQGFTSNDTKYHYECTTKDVQLTMNLVGTLAAKHRVIENMHRHTLLTG